MEEASRARRPLLSKGISRQIDCSIKVNIQKKVHGQLKDGTSLLCLVVAFIWRLPIARGDHIFLCVTATRQTLFNRYDTILPPRHVRAGVWLAFDKSHPTLPPPRLSSAQRSSTRVPPPWRPMASRSTRPSRTTMARRSRPRVRRQVEAGVMHSSG